MLFHHLAVELFGRITAAPGPSHVARQLQTVATNNTAFAPLFAL